MSKPDPLDFLHQPAQPVTPGTQVAADAADVLPQQVADQLLRIAGVEGAWIEREADGTRSVVVHVSTPGRPAGLPATIYGLPLRVVGHEPIRAQGA